MRRAANHLRARPGPWILVLLVMLGCMAAAHGQDTDVVFCVREWEGAVHCYVLDTINSLEFAGRGLVIETAYGMENVDLTAIAWIDINTEFSDVEDPDAWTRPIANVTHLLHRRPNPFSGEAILSFELPQPGHVSVEVFGLDGRLVRQLVRGELTSGWHAVAWDGRDDAGRAVLAGVYLCRLTGPGVTDGRRVIKLR